MRIGIIGTGTVGRALATRLLQLGHEITLGSRTRDSEAALSWLASVTPEYQARALIGTFADAAASAELVINATGGGVSLDALNMAGHDALAGKPLLDLANPLDFSNGFPPSLSVCNTDSLGEAIQREFPETHVVKALNTMSCEIMVDPSRVPGEHVVFVAGNNDEAKAQVCDLLSQFGWGTNQIIDLGDISAARATEMFLPLWLRIMGKLGSAEFNIAIAQ